MLDQQVYTLHQSPVTQWESGPAPVESLRVLLSSLIDYAGLFPPASLSMREAARNYAAYRQSEHGWMLGRFVLPVARLDEFELEVARTWRKPSRRLRAEPHLAPPAWQVSALATERLEADLAAIDKFNHAHEGALTIDAIELRTEACTDIEHAMRHVPAGLTAYFEIPLARDPNELLPALALTKARAKVRTGGLTQESFPSHSDLLRFLQCSAEAKVPFKATAGLHHPLRSVHRFAYEADSPCGWMHGFINVFLAAAFVRAKTKVHALELLHEKCADAFEFDELGVEWKSHRLKTEQLRRARERFAISFGSCSFEEPINDLQQLGWLSRGCWG